MSELTPCNFCILNCYKQEVRGTDQKITLRIANGGGWDVYRHSKEVKIPIDHKYDDHNPTEVDDCWIGWFMELSDECCC